MSQAGPLSVVVAGGGTAGHVEPALALADAVRRLRPDAVVTALGTASGLEARLVPARGYVLAEIPRVPLPRRPTVDLLRLPGRVAGAVRATRAHLDRVQADVVVGFGGYVALPAYLAARRRGTPVVVHEANARAGLANRVGARLTPHVAAAVEGSGLRGAQVLGIPLRPQIAELDRAAARAEARRWFDLPAEGPVLLVTGGSQGAQRINTAVTGAAADLAAAGVHVLHVAGPKQAEAVTAALGRQPPATRSPGPPPTHSPGPPPTHSPWPPPTHSPWPPPTHHVLPYVDRMDLAYAAADLVVCRAGAMTCAEVAAVGLPALYVPLPIGNGEQALNARPVVDAGGGLLVEDAAFDADRVRTEVLPLLLDTGRLQAMSRAAARSGHREAGQALAELVLRAAATGQARSR